MPSGSRWLPLWKERFSKFWHTDNPRMAIVRDVAVAGLIVGFLLAAIWIYAGQPLSQAPVVSVESGSMMHGPFTGDPRSARATPWSDPPFGRIGTIDPGDIVFVKRVKAPSSVEVAFGTGGRSGYGGHGDVIVFKPNGSGSMTRVIHRAMLYIEANTEGCTPNVDCEYRIPAFCFNGGLQQWSGGQNLDKYCTGSRDPITVSLRRDGLFLDLQNFPCAGGFSSCPPFYSGFITKGDNNEAADQATTISRTVQMSWIIGKARGEIPWFGLIKLALYGNPTYGTNTDPTGGRNWHILAASAPWDIWTCLFLSLAVLIAIPMVIDLVANYRAKQQERKKPPKAP